MRKAELKLEQHSFLPYSLLAQQGGEADWSGWSLDQ